MHANTPSTLNASARGEIVLADEDERILWQRWRAEQDASARERLVLLYLEYARMVAAKSFARRYNNEFEFGEYMQFATVGLLEAIDRYDPGYQVSFKTFAARRINGAILNGIARLSEQHQQISARQRMLTDRTKSISADGEGEDKNRDVFEQMAEVAIGLALGFILEGSSMYQDQELMMPDNSYRHLELKQLRERINALIDSLPERERLLIKYHYIHHLQFEAISGIFAVSKGRISQLHRQAIERLRGLVKKMRPSDLAW